MILHRNRLERPPGTACLLMLVGTLMATLCGRRSPATLLVSICAPLPPFLLGSEYADYRGCLERMRHERGHIAPQVEAAIVPPRPTYPRLRTANVFHDKRNVPPCRLACLALDAEAGVEQFVIWRRESLGTTSTAWHGSCGETARGTGGDSRRISRNSGAVDQSAHRAESAWPGIASGAVVAPN